MRKLSKFTCFGPNSWSFLVHFFAHGILCNYGKLTAKNWPRDAEHLVVRSYPYQVKQYPLSAMVFASFLGVISNTDHRHFCLPNFPEVLNHTSVANQRSSFANTMYTILTVESVPHIDPCTVVKKWRRMLDGFASLKLSKCNFG